MDARAAETHLSVLWGGNENHPNTDLSAAGVQDNSGGVAAGCVSTRLNLKTQRAVLGAEVFVRLQNEQNRQNNRQMPLFVDATSTKGAGVQNVQVIVRLEHPRHQ